MSASHDLVTIGAYTKDTIVSRAGTRHVHGGGYSYAAHAAKLSGLEIAAITRLAPEDIHSTAALRAAHIPVHVFESAHSTVMRLEYPTDDVDERILTVASVAEPFGPEHIAHIEARAFLVSASIRGEVPLDVMRALRERKALIGADVQGFVRVVGPGGTLHYTTWPEQQDILPLIDVLKTDAVEAEFLTGHGDIHRAASTLAAQGPREIVLTHRDGVLVLADGRYHEAGFFPEPLRGRSGRGDTCVGSYLSRRLLASPADATIWAAALTSVKMEAEGPILRPVEDVHAMIARRYTPRRAEAS